ncbi:MAG: hypothetical protein CMJ88_07810 [Planctomycetes bacterium]|nr:hypothetical protein [Planctomycetota bacterium]
MRAPTVWICACAATAACVWQPAPLSVADQLLLGATALRSGRLADARELIDGARDRDPSSVTAAQWSGQLADLLWQDDLSIRERMSAVRLARAARREDLVAELRGQLGDQLFRAGRWGESSTSLLAGARGVQEERRRAFAVVAASLPYVRKFSGPLLTERPLQLGQVPEFICHSKDKKRAFAIDTGTSMTTVASSFASELGVRSRRPAGAALDGQGRRLPVEIGLLPQFGIGSVEVGAVPVMVVADSALQLRDLHGGAERAPRGVLGLDLIGACRLTIDPERGGVVLAVSQGLPVERSVQCARVEGRCLVPVIVEGAQLWFVLDPGASHSSLTSSGLARIAGGRERAAAAFRRVRTVGGGVVAVRELRGIVLRCSEARFLQVTLPIVDRGHSDFFPVHGVIGIDLLSRCRVTLDRGRARLTAAG